MHFSAVLLAGGKSSRMGRDKAALIVGGIPLWRRQLATLGATGADEVFVSGAADGPWAEIECVSDDVKEAGPLAGIAASLRRCANPWLLVLAVDMPAMTSDFLRDLAARAERTRRGFVPVLNGRPEPLAAIYPRAALAIADERLREQQRKLEDFVTALDRADLISREEVSQKDAVLFENWNEPGDVMRTRNT